VTPHDRYYGLLAEFDDVTKLVHACETLRDEGYRNWDAHTPFPVHGMDAAMGIRGTRLPWVVLACGLTGLAVALLMIWWMNAIDYPFVIAGKPLFALPPAIPVVFELTVLLSALGTFFSLWLGNGLPRLHHPLFSSDRFRRATQDRFFIAVEAHDPKFDRETTRLLLSRLGSTAVEDVQDEAED